MNDHADNTLTAPASERGASIASRPDTGQVVQALTFAIERIKASDSKPGWTPWALVAAGTGACWALLSTLGQENAPTLSSVVKWSVLVVVLAESVRVLWRFVPLSTPSRPRADRFSLSSNEFRSDRLAILYVLAQSLTVLYVLRAFPLWADALFVRTATVSYAVVAVAAVCAFAMSFVGFAAPSEAFEGRATNVPFRVAGGLFVLLHASLAYAVVKLLLRDYPGLNVATIKAACLVFAILLIARFLLISTAEAPLIQTLCDIRNRLLLGQMTVTEALGDIEIATLGLSASDVLQERIRSLLRVQEEMRAEFRSGATEVAQLKGLLDNAAKATTEEAIACRKAICSGIAARIGRVESLRARYAGEFKKFELRAQVLASMSTCQDKIMAPIRAQLAVGANGISEDFGKYKQAIGDAATCAACPACPPAPSPQRFPCTQQYSSEAA